ncbi:PEPxxWA-CTERM sorting domain-containing protein [Phenylobacterium sp.]|uniref:PEPxxWA-CTERM sorting domain-containing protein n=1 Tax=Phenylobacterium sp. TaxID=1871053 RepID=UPI0025D71278|nr:PEPxxWA-CTERM sorting domain-containing protein [Phenylobacterium sp.]MBX3483423.1 PEP-CTERM sorting domain-containing protein [Phenylobacterium sp.]MCW5759445.1 PEP-CTERM sorting domain-containing protein [Phenylobacterium sp.]
MRGFGVLLGGLAGALTLSVVSAANAGVLVASGDEWTLSDYAYGAPYQAGTQAFVQDLASTFGGSNYLLLTGNSNVPVAQLSSLTDQLTALGKTVQTSATFDLAIASGYDAVFHFGQAFTGAQLADLSAYLSGGGDAYVSLGSGWYGDAASEAATWNPLLADYGLVAGSTWFSAPDFVNVTVTQGPSGATNLIWGYGQSIDRLPVGDGVSYVRGSFVGGPQDIGLVGSSRPLGVALVPEPGTWGLMILGFAGMGLALRRRRGTMAGYSVKAT